MPLPVQLDPLLAAVLVQLAVDGDGGTPGVREDVRGPNARLLRLGENDRPVRPGHERGEIAYHRLLHGGLRQESPPGREPGHEEARQAAAPAGRAVLCQPADRPQEFAHWFSGHLMLRDQAHPCRTEIVGQLVAETPLPGAQRDADPRQDEGRDQTVPDRLPVSEVVHDAAETCAEELIPDIVAVQRGGQPETPPELRVQAIGEPVRPVTMTLVGDDLRRFAEAVGGPSPSAPW